MKTVRWLTKPEKGTILKNNERNRSQEDASGPPVPRHQEGTGVVPRATDKVREVIRAPSVTAPSSTARTREAGRFPEPHPGLTEGLQLMKAGSNTAVILSTGYGDADRNIPGNSVLVFEVELIDVKQ